MANWLAYWLINVHEFQFFQPPWQQLCYHSVAYERRQVLGDIIITLRFPGNLFRVKSFARKWEKKSVARVLSVFCKAVETATSITSCNSENEVQFYFIAIGTALQLQHSNALPNTVSVGYKPVSVDYCEWIDLLTIWPRFIPINSWIFCQMTRFPYTDTTLITDHCKTNESTSERLSLHFAKIAIWSNG